jgi:xylulokinase
VPSLSSLDPRQPLASHFSSHSFSLPNTPTAQDTSAHAHALAFEALLGGPDLMAQRVGTSAAPSLVAAQLLRVREQLSNEVWLRTGRVQLASAFICSLLIGKWAPMNEAEACATGMYVHRERDRDKPSSTGGWDEGVLDIIGGSKEEGRKVRGWLGEVDSNGGAKKAGQVSRYMVERYGFDPGKNNFQGILYCMGPTLFQKPLSRLSLSISSHLTSRFCLVLPMQFCPLGLWTFF